MAKFGGSWKFVISFVVMMVVYTLINVLMTKPWDPYPFILLNLFLSMLAAIQAPSHNDEPESTGQQRSHAE